MKTSETEATFRSMLEEAGFDFETPDPKQAWKTFKTFAREPVECAEDGILFECGTYSFTGEKLYHLGFVRQFSIDDESGEYDHMEQLHCRLTCQPTDLFSKLQTNLWAFEFESLDDYFTEIENLEEFRVSLENQQTWACEVYQERV